MKQFRLIKLYPSSPEIGTIAEFEEEMQQFKAKGVKGFWPELYFTSFPELWEEVKQADLTYEVLSYIDPGNTIYTKSEYPHEFHRYSDSDHSFLSIHSIRRLLDDVIFTLGDRITSLLGNEYEIENFIVLPKSEDLGINKSNDGFMSYSTLKHIKHAKKPIFTSIDGVKIFEGDSYWIVYDNNYGHIASRLSKEFIDTADKIDALNPSIHRFKSQSKAEGFLSFITPKKPLFITDDGVEIFDENTPVYELLHHNKVLKMPIRSTNKAIIERSTYIGVPSVTSYPIFSTREKATEALMFYAPCLSLNDVMSIYVSAGFKGISATHQTRAIEALVKSKLNK